MKPISLVIDGINSFYERQEIDFRFDGLFCISGDTGSGKTTILDCIIIALFGNSNRASTLGDYINLKRDRAEIRLVFEASVDGVRQTYEVVRVLNRSGASKAKLISLTSGETLAEQTTQVNAILKSIVGLTLEDFTQMVILEQGKFARFLTASKKERNETVGNLFKLHKYKELGSKFNLQMKEIKREIDNMDERLAELKEVTLAATEQKEKDIRASKKCAVVMADDERKLIGEIELLQDVKRAYDKCVLAEKRLADEQLKLKESESLLARAKVNTLEAESKLKTVSDSRAECELTVARIGDMQNLLNELSRRNGNIENLAREWKIANADEQRLKGEYAQLVEKERNYQSTLSTLKGSIFTFADFGEKAEYYDVFDIKSQVDTLRAEYTLAARSYADFDKKVKDLSEKVASYTDNQLLAMRQSKLSQDKCNLIRAELAELNKKREQEQRIEAAQFIRSGLSVGDACPVCGGTVAHISQKSERVESQTLLEAKERELAVAERESQINEKNLYSFNTRLEESQKALLAAQNEQGECKKQLSKICETIRVPDKIDEISRLATEACEVQKKLTFVQSEVKLIGQRHEAAISKAEDIKKRGTEERAQANRLKQDIEGKISLSISEQESYYKRLESLTAEVQTLTDQLNEMRIEQDRLTGIVAASQMAVRLLHEEAAGKPNFDENVLTMRVGGLQKLKGEREQLIATIASDEKELEVMRKNLERKRIIEKEKADKKRKYDIYADIYKLVSGDKFIEYIAEEYILQFTAGASLVLNDITAGKYTLDYIGGTFFVKDFLSGGMERKASTLSGGETFLASLSLAIAISREIARYKTYEFFFLDEGFGTLDSYSIDIAYNALTSLASDTLVGVVTHRSELTERIFDKITVLSAGADRGSIILRSD